MNLRCHRLHKVQPRNARVRKGTVAVAVAMVLAFVAGCTGPPETVPTSSTSAQPTDAAAFVAQAPTWEVGQSWTYAASGHWDSVGTFTVVVAQAGPTGYLAAAGAKEELVDEVAWNHLYYGRVDLQLQQVDADGNPRGNQWLHFPLSNGTTWEFRPGVGPNVTAHAARIETALGTYPGFLIQGQNERARVEIAYVPALEAVTRFQAQGLDEPGPGFRIDLAATGKRTQWVWFESRDAFGSEAVRDPADLDPADPVGTAPAASPSQVEVLDTDDEVIVWALASTGSKGIVHRPPPAEPWTFDGAGEPNFTIARLEANPGTWRMTGMANPPDGWVYIQAHAVRWLPGSLGHST